MSILLQNLSVCFSFFPGEQGLIFGMELYPNLHSSAIHFGYSLKQGYFFKDLKLEFKNCWLKKKEPGRSSTEKGSMFLGRKYGNSTTPICKTPTGVRLGWSGNEYKCTQSCSHLGLSALRAPLLSYFLLCCRLPAALCKHTPLLWLFLK